MPDEGALDRLTYVEPTPDEAAAIAGFTIDDVPKLDTGALDSWEEPGDLCTAIVVILIGGVDFELRCEIDGPHDEHEALLRWKTPNDDEPT